jgi:hypothetical protein
MLIKVQVVDLNCHGPSPSRCLKFAVNLEASRIRFIRVGAKLEVSGSGSSEAPGRGSSESAQLPLAVSPALPLAVAVTRAVTVTVPELGRQNLARLGLRDLQGLRRPFM